MHTRTHGKFVTLGQITPEHRARSGGKAYNCALLRQAGFQVPDGLVVLSDATDEDVEEASTHPWCNGFADDVRFAVRSSGIGEDSEGQSFAGIHQTLLNVQRQFLSRAVAECRASAHSPQALEYRHAQGLATDSIQIGVLIQPMVQPVAAGVAFTVNPVTGAAGELVINSSWGVGEALVSGQVDPDEFVVGKSNGEILWSRIGEKQGDADRESLSPSQVEDLARVLLAIERHYQAPQDIEWCFDGNAFWIVQSRPITTAHARETETEWTRANLAEVLPDLTSPQALAAFEQLLNVAERKYMGRMLPPNEVLGPTLKSFAGRLYFNLSQMKRVCALSGVAPAVMLRSVGHAEAITPEDEQTPRIAVRELLPCLPDLLRMVWKHFRAGAIVRRSDDAMWAFKERVGTIDSRTLPDDEVWAITKEWFDDATDTMQTVLLLSGVLFQEMPVRKACERVGFPYERLVFPQLAIGERSVSAQQAFDLVRLADVARREPAVVDYLLDDTSDLSRARTALAGTGFAAALEQFLQTYGHRGRYESDWSLPRYSEDPTPLLRALRVHVANDSDNTIAETIHRQERDAAEAWTQFTTCLTPWQRLTMLPRVRRAIARIKQYYVWRERVRSDMVRVLAAMRVWHLTLADRFVERGWIDNRDDYFLIRFEEIERVLTGVREPATLRDIVALRREELARYRSIHMPLLMRESELPGLIRTAGVSSRSGDERQLSGHPVSSGCVEAEVVVVRDPGDFGRMKPGAILVAPATDPSWTPLFTLASGVIVEVGGGLSHASTIAREYGLPAIANVKHATKRLKTGERVKLDAIHGLVYKLAV